ncbi:hypothetical protein GE061_016723 [Apolygus lucorum]|uniref:Uncharacterized protein n=1 Tax=Apolygus lucorum TaxID=248454 RepID=A0A6A4JLN3_APOLU|nr:hypothetical protein GE061_016723 [Apolygus lucorum]
MLVSLLRSWRSTQSLSAIVPVTRQFKNNSPILAKELFPLQGFQTTEIHSESYSPEYAVSYTQQFRQNSIDVRGPEVVYFWDKLKKCFGSKKGEKKKKGKKAKKQSCKKKKCGKQKDSCLKKKDSCEKPDEKKELCKTDSKKADGDKKDVKADPCKKKEEKKEDPCKKKEEKKKEDPCKKKEEKKKEDPCKKKEEKKKEDPCKKKEEKKEDPCKKKEDPCKKKEVKKEDPCKKKEDPCKKKEEKKEDPCKKKEDPCKKKEDPCKKKEDPCKKKEEKKEDPCKKKEDPCKKKEEKKEDPCKKKEDPCKKKEEKKEDPCKKKEDPCKKKEDPCKKKEDPCKKKEDPCKKKEDRCKKKEEKKEDPCAPCNKKEDPCKKKEEKKEDPCKKKEDPCKKKEDPCKKKEDPCKKKDPCAKFIPESPDSHESFVLFSRTDAFCKDEERCSKPCKDPCAEGACDVIPGQNEPCSVASSWKIKVRPCRQASPCQSKKAVPPSGPCIIDKVDIVEQKLEPGDNCGLTKHPCGKKVCPNKCEVKRKTKFSDLQEEPQVAIKNLLDVLGYQTSVFQSMSTLNFAYARGPVPPNRAPDPRQPASGQNIPANEPPPAQKYSEKVAGLLEKLRGLWLGQGAANTPVEANQPVKPDKQPHPGRPSSGRRLFGIIGSETDIIEKCESKSISAVASLESLSAEGDSHVLFMTDDFESCEDSIPPCPTEPESLPCPALPEDCVKTTDDIWSDIDTNWGYEKFPWKSNIVKDERLDEVSKGSDDPYANNKL